MQATAVKIGILSLLFLLVSTGFSANRKNINSANDLAVSNDTKEDSVSRPKRKYQTLRIDEPPVVDGKLNDECWKLGEWQSDYKQYSPEYNGNPTYKTELKILFDDKNIYAAIRAYDDMS